MNPRGPWQEPNASYIALRIERGPKPDDLLLRGHRPRDPFTSHLLLRHPRQVNYVYPSLVQKTQSSYFVLLNYHCNFPDRATRVYLNHLQLFLLPVIDVLLIEQQL